MDTIILGKTTMRDKFSGFTGLVTAKAEYFQASPSLRLTNIGDGKTFSENWFDLGRLEII